MYCNRGKGKRLYFEHLLCGNKILTCPLRGVDETEAQGEKASPEI